MKTTFKKTLLAVALAGVGASAQAATVAQVATDYSKQHVAGLSATTAVTTDFTVALAAEYKNDDVVTIKFSSPLRTGYTAPASVVATGTSKAIVTLGLLSQTSDTLTYRVTDVNKTAGNSTIATTLTFTGVSFNASTLLSVTDIKATFSAKTATGNFDLDAGENNTKKILAAVDQFEGKVTTKFSGTIELPGRTALKTTPTPTSLVTTFTNTSTGLRDYVTLTAVKHTLEGDFSWIKDTNANAGLQPATDVVAVPTGCTLSATETTATKLVVDCDATPLTVDFDLSLNTAAAGVPASTTTAANKATTLKGTKYALSSVVSYTLPSSTTTGTFSTLSAADAGDWKVDGVYADIPYLVVGNVGTRKFGHVVNVTNNHSQAGNITLDVYREDGTLVAERVAAGSVKPNEIKRLSENINSILGTGFNGRFSAKVFVEVPAGKADIYSAYTDSDSAERAIVINSTNK